MNHIYTDMKANQRYHIDDVRSTAFCNELQSHLIFVKKDDIDICALRFDSEQAEMRSDISCLEGLH